MKIDLNQTPEQDIFRNRKKYIIWFSFFMLLVCVAVAIGFFVFYSNSNEAQNVEDWALGILVAAAVGVTIFGNRLQAYKALFPPQQEELISLRSQYPVIEKYCSAVDLMQRKFIRAEYEACVEYAEHQESAKEKNQAEQAVYGPAENPDKKNS